MALFQGNLRSAPIIAFPLLPQFIIGFWIFVLTIGYQFWLATLSKIDCMDINCENEYKSGHPAAG